MFWEVIDFVIPSVITAKKKERKRDWERYTALQLNLGLSVMVNPSYEWKGYKWNMYGNIKSILPLLTSFLPYVSKALSQGH